MNYCFVMEVRAIRAPLNIGWTRCVRKPVVGKPVVGTTVVFIGGELALILRRFGFCFGVLLAAAELSDDDIDDFCSVKFSNVVDTSCICLVSMVCRKMSDTIVIATGLSTTTAVVSSIS